jgi:putative transposon-encoded protein
MRIYIVYMGRFDIEGEEVIDGEAKPFGNGAHVTVPKEWRRASVKVVRTGDPWTPADGLELPLAAELGSYQRRTGCVRLPEPLLEKLGLDPGSAVELSGERTVAAKVWRTDRNDTDEVLRAPPSVRLSLGLDLEDPVTVRPASPRLAREVVLAVADDDVGDEDLAADLDAGVAADLDAGVAADLNADAAADLNAEDVPGSLVDHPLVAGQLLAVPVGGGILRSPRGVAPLRVLDTGPDGVVTVGPETSVRLD